MDHFHQFPPIGTNAEPMPEAYVLLGGIAGVTERIELGTMVTGVTYRNPALLAKMVTTLDVVSGGRAWLGIGAGWQQDEYRAYGFGDELPGAGARLDLLEDTLRIARAMFTGSPATVEGRVASVRGAMNVPPPIAAGGPRILVGGAGERRLLKLVARYADACNLVGDAASVRHKLEVLDRHCADVGRDPGEIRRTHLGGIVVADSVAEAEARVRVAAEGSGMDVETVRSLVVAGRPEDVREHCEALLATGLDELIFVTAGPWSAERLGAAGAALAPLL
jgi:alkanesulfonate monooxygenase SsuD/methylene tetrahydromethanopterin reductase-like flavin-dependent oxidoreductase (luciferase family)